MSQTQEDIPNAIPDVMLHDMLSKALPAVLQDMLAPVINLEMLKRKEALTEKEVEALYGISAYTLKAKRQKGGGPVYYQGVERGAVLYTHAAVKNYLDTLKKKV